MLYATLFVVAYHGALRVSECVVTGKTEHAMCAQYFQLVKCGEEVVAYQLTLPSYKHSGERLVPIRFTQHGDATCPVYWLNTYFKLQGLEAGPVFLKSNGKPSSQLLGDFQSAAVLPLATHVPCLALCEVASGIAAVVTDFRYCTEFMEF